MHSSLPRSQVSFNYFKHLLYQSKCWSHLPPPPPPSPNCCTIMLVLDELGTEVINNDFGARAFLVAALIGLLHA